MADYFFNLGRGFLWWFKAIIGKTVPEYCVVAADSSYYAPSQEIIDRAVEMLADMKVEYGFVSANYKAEVWDCDNAALFDWNALSNIILPELVPDRTEPFKCGMFSFTRDNGSRHRVAYVENDEGDRTYTDTYEINGTIVRTLSDTEEAAGEDLI